MSTAYGLDSTQHTNVNPSNGQLLRYGVLADMEECLKEHHARIGAVIIECIRNTGK
jgi:ornithine--oxo-acid transaminase